MVPQASFVADSGNPPDNPEDGHGCSHLHFIDEETEVPSG